MDHGYYSLHFYKGWKCTDAGMHACKKRPTQASSGLAPKPAVGVHLHSQFKITTLSSPHSTSTPIPLIIQTDINRILKAAAIFLLFLHGQRIPRHHLKSLLHVRIILSRDLKIRDPAPALTVGHGPLCADGAPVIADVDLVPEDDEGEGFWVARGGLDEEFVAPGVEGLEGFGRVDVVDEDAAVGTAVEGYTEGLEALLARRVPELFRRRHREVSLCGEDWQRCTHGEEKV
jgi:hypothetical protein